MLATSCRRAPRAPRSVTRQFPAHARRRYGAWEMTLTRRCAALLLAGFILAACTTPEEKLIDRRHRLRATLDELYASYSDRDGTAEARDAGSGVVGRFLAGVDRAHFDEYCLAIGRGERPFSLSAKVETFMNEPRNVKRCRKAAEVQLSIEELERELAAR